MAVLLELETLPTHGVVTLKIDTHFDIKITAHQARQRVDRWLLNQVSYLMGAGEPMLVVAHEVVWRVPIYLSTPDMGQLGPLALVDVTIDDGSLATSAKLKAEIIRQAEKWVKSLPPYQAHIAPASEYLATNVPPAPRLRVTDPGDLERDEYYAIVAL